MSAERIGLYEATVLRLEAQIAGNELARKRLIWFLVGGLALAPVALLINWVVSLGLAVAGVSVFGVGHYLAMIHIEEDRNAIREARDVLADLRHEPAHAVAVAETQDRNSDT